MIIAPSGDVDVSALPSLQSSFDRALLSANAGVVLDLSAVVSLDSMGLSLIEAHARQCEQARCPFSIAAPDIGVRRHLFGTRVDDLVCADLRSALSALETVGT